MYIMGHKPDKLHVSAKSQRNSMFTLIELLVNTALLLMCFEPQPSRYER